MPDINADARFARVPQIEKPRSIFKQTNTHLTTFNVGELIPIYSQFFYPGTTIKMNLASVVRLQTLLTPIFSNLYLDVFAFWTPMRLTWSHTKEFFGENNASAWAPSVTYQVPSISAPSGGFDVYSIAGRMHYPTGVNWTNSAERRPMVLPIRSYAIIANEYFRDENLTNPLNIPIGDTNQTGTNGSSYVNDVANGGAPFKVSKYFDRFTGCLPSPLKNQTPVSIFETGTRAPIFADSTLSHSVGDTVPSSYTGIQFMMKDSSGNYAAITGKHTVDLNSGILSYNSGTISDSTSTIYPVNMWADLSASVSAVTISELRLAFALQRYYEAIARSGSRYRELLRGLWGVTPADSTMQVPQYLGGKRIPIQIHEVINQAQATNDYLGDLGAMSHTADYDELFDFSCDEHGFLQILCCARYDHLYSQGCERYLSRLNREDYYVPEFAFISEQPVYTDEICATDTNMATADVFGYQEAWSDLRYKQSFVSGEFKPGIANTLASWHLGDYYTTAPTLSDAWIREDGSIVDRVLAVASTNSNQIMADFYFDATVTAVLPMYSVPGLIDHY